MINIALAVYLEAAFRSNLMPLQQIVLRSFDLRLWWDDQSEEDRDLALRTYASLLPSSPVWAKRVSHPRKCVAYLVQRVGA